MEWLKKFMDQVMDAFARGARGDTPPGSTDKPANMAPVIARDALVAFIELVLTAAAIFTCVIASGFLVKLVLVIAILVSGIRTYSAAVRLRDLLTRPSNQP